MQRFATYFSVLACVLLLAACSGKNRPDEIVSGTVAEDTVTITATVVRIDHEDRIVRLQKENGEFVGIRVKDDVRNLDQVKKGDKVKAVYHQSLAFSVKKKGVTEPGVDVASDAGRTPLGAKPGVAAAVAVTVTSTIKSIDKKTPAVTLEGPDGELTTIKVRNPANLENVKKGDLVEITYTEATAIAVQGIN